MTSSTTSKQSKVEVERVDLAIQDTLSMPIEDRLQLLANLIVDKIIEDQEVGELLLKHIAGIEND